MKHTHVVLISTKFFGHVEGIQKIKITTAIQNIFLTYSIAILNMIVYHTLNFNGQDSINILIFKVIVQKYSTTTQEFRQRAKYLTREYQVEQRMARKIQLGAEVSRKKIEAENKLMQKSEANDNYVRKICKLLGKEENEEHSKDVSMENI